MATHQLPPSVFEPLSELTQGNGPVLLVLVGPNGAGKSTFFRRYLSGVGLPFINADLIALSLTEAGAAPGESTERLAAKMADRQRQDLISEGRSFMTETVFSDPVGAKVSELQRAQKLGYSICMVFMCVDSADLSVLRVKSRVQSGGHNVPGDKIVARYERMRSNVKSALTFVDFAVLVDNSSFSQPLRPVATTAKGRVTHRIANLPWWAEDVLPGHI